MMRHSDTKADTRGWQARLRLLGLLSRRTGQGLLALLIGVPMLFFLFAVLVSVFLVAKAPQDKAALVAAHPNAEPGKACGRIGNITIKFDEDYISFPASATYDGVDYWGGEGHLNKEKWCDDWLRSVNFTIDWPLMTPSKHNDTFYFREDPKHIVLTLRHNFSNDPADAQSGVLAWIISGDSKDLDAEIDWVKIKRRAKWRNAIGLYEIEAYSDSPDSEKNTAYWRESSDGKIDVFIYCHEWRKSGSTSCEQRFFSSRQNIWIENNYRKSLVKEWWLILNSSIAFSDKITVPSEVHQ